MVWFIIWAVCSALSWLCLCKVWLIKCGRVKIGEALLFALVSWVGPFSLLCGLLFLAVAWLPKKMEDWGPFTDRVLFSCEEGE